MSGIIQAILIVGGTGLIFGAILAFASFIFHVEEDERIGQIAAELPGANCGGCGYAGCSAYASAVVSHGAPVNACSVGKASLAEKIAAIMGVDAVASEPTSARVLCNGTCSVALDKYEYAGISDCASANKLAGGRKSCPNGCLGLGSCAEVCQFDAISIVDSIAHINPEKCVSCGKCVEACPKKIISIMPLAQKYFVKCSATTPGAATNKNCSVGCIGCKICEKNCPTQAIKVENNLAVIDYSLCTSCGLCAEKCPKKIIISSL